MAEPTTNHRAASRAAVRQYRKAARKHLEYAHELMLAGWFGEAGVELRLADRLGLVALAERLGEPK